MISLMNTQIIKGVRLKEIKLTVEEIEEIRENMNKEPYIEKTKHLPLALDLTDTIRMLQEAKEEILSMPGVDVDSLCVECKDWPVPFGHGDTIDGLEISYEIPYNIDDMFEEYCENALEGKKQRYKQFLELKEEFEEE